MSVTLAQYRDLCRKPAKYRNQPVVSAEGIRFASRKEARRYAELQLMEKAGEITDLEPHPRFSLDVNGVHIGFFTADAAYRDRSGAKFVEDVKAPATRTTAYKLRKRLLRAIHGIDVREV